MKQTQCMSKWIATFSLFIGFVTAQECQAQTWSQGFLFQYDVKKFHGTFGDLQTTKK